MPTYEYECAACGHAMEAFQRMSDPALRKCPKCGKPKLKRLISGGAGVIFKGSGFYETDYKRSRRGGEGGSDKAPADGASKGETKPEPKSDAKTDAAPAAKPESKAKKDSAAKKD